MSNLKIHAEEEMRRAGLYDKDADYGGMIPEAVMALIKAHAAQGHSGASSWLTLEIFNELVNFRPLTPLTSDPSEWNDVSGLCAKPTWQNKRDSRVFSDDAGKTWFSIDKNNEPVASNNNKEIIGINV